MIGFMKRVLVGVVASIFSLTMLDGTAGASSAVVIQSLSRTVQETNFYTLNIDSLIIPNSTSLITAVSGDKIFIGDRPTRTLYLYLAPNLGTDIALEQSIAVPAPLEPGNKNNALLDMIATKDHLYLAVVDGATDYPTCGGVRIYDYTIASLANAPKLIFKSTPCARGDLFYDARLALKGNDLYIAGGNTLVKYDDGTFPLPDSKDYVTGMPFPKTNYFGAVSSINLSTKKVTLVATGLRHLGGLVWDAERKIMWETENGPRGGDELNVILNGKNYGWPQVTLGRPYDTENTPTGGVKTNSIGSSQAPIYGWTPSISPSTVRKVPAKGEFAKYWAGDLIVGSLKGNQLRRLRISPSNTVMYDEPIPVGDRIRTLDFLSDGRLLLATDTGRLFIVSDSQVLGTGRYPKDPPTPEVK
jgi:hypothetical protein